MDFLSGIEKRVTGDMVVNLAKTFKEDQVVASLRQMHPNKALRPDRLPLVFFPTKAILLALNIGQVPKDLNYTFITLISKKKHPIQVRDYRPISLCNVLYKLISK